MSVNAKMKKICDNIRLRTGGTALLNLDQIADAIMQIGEATNPATIVYRTIGTTYPPVQNPGESAFSGYDIDVPNALADDIHAYIDEVVSGKSTVTKEILGKESSGKYDMARYIYADRQHIAWQEQNHPKMYAWENGGTTIYSTSVSPRIGDNMYTNPVIGDKYGAQAGTETEIVTVPGKAVIIRGQRYSQSGGKFSAETTCASLVIPTEYYYDSANGQASRHTLVLTNATFHQSRTGFYIGDDKITFPRAGNMSKTGTTATISPSGTVDYGQKYSILFLTYDGSQTFANTTVTIDGVSLDVIVTDSTADSVKAAHATTKEVEVETEAVPATITAISATRRSRTINGLEFVRYADGDVEPTVIYTALGDSRNGNATITQDGATYNRYPLGDLGANREKLIPIFIYANEHGVDVTRMDSSSPNYGAWETKMCALVAARFLRDLASGAQETNALYKFIRENCMVIVIPVANPFGFNMPVTGDTNSVNSGYYNCNSVNINRGYDTPGWDDPSMDWNKSPYPGSEIENQYIMNTMVESGAVVAMSLHGLGSWQGYCAHQGQSPDGSDYNRDKLAKVNTFLQNNYGYTLRYYDQESDGTPKVAVNMPDTTCKSPSYITQCGAYGGIVEMSPDDVKTSGWKQEMKANVVENAYAQTLNLMAMWLSDYLEMV